jgi:hypothetical protein
MMTVRYAADDIVDRFPRNCGSGVDSHSFVCSLAIWLESPEKVGGTVCVADLKRNFCFSDICKSNQRQALPCFFRVRLVNASVCSGLPEWCWPLRVADREKHTN